MSAAVERSESGHCWRADSDFVAPIEKLAGTSQKSAAAAASSSPDANHLRFNPTDKPAGK